MSQGTKYTLTELAEASEVSGRTIRHYISQGLVEAAVKKGPESHYFPSHLDRLQVIRKLKSQGLSLEQIKIKLGILQEPVAPLGFPLLRVLVAPDIEVNVAAEMPPARKRKVEAALKEFIRAVSETTNTRTDQENPNE